MKKRKAYSFRIYVIVVFFLCIVLEFFLEGFYDGFFYGLGETVVERDIVRDQMAYWGTKFVAAGLSFLLINRKLARPIEQLAGSMSKIAQGNLSERASAGLPREYEQIEKAFNQMADALSRAQKERLEQQEANQLLYANIAHDLKTPMTMAMGYARALGRDDMIGPEKQKEYLQTIVNQTEHANELLDRLLTYTRLENQIYQLNYTKSDMAEVLRSTVAQFYGSLEEHQSEVTIRIPDHPVVYSFDIVEMERVFRNLIVNVVKHTPVGTSCIISLEELEDQGIQIDILDHGPFLTEEIKDKMFQPFVRGDASRNTAGGSGLGLSIVQKIVWRHQAEIRYMEDEVTGYKGFQILFP